MENQIENSFELAEDEDEQEFLRRQREMETAEEQEQAASAIVPLIKFFAKDKEFEHEEINSRVISQHQRLLTELNALHKSNYRSNDSYLPQYPSSRMRKEILMTFLPWVEEEVADIGSYLALRIGCPVVNLEFSPNEYGYDFALDELLVKNFERLGWKFVLLPPSRIEDEFKSDPWLWTTQLRNQLEEAGATDIKVMTCSSLDPRRELIPNSFALGGFDVDCIFSSELHLHGKLWAPPTGVGRNVADQMEAIAGDGGLPVDITPISWDDYRFQKSEQMVIASRQFPAAQSVGVPAIKREAGMIEDYEVPSSVKLKATVAPHGLRKTQNAKADFGLRVKQWGGCAITITPLRSVNKSIEQNFGGQTRGGLLDNRTMQSVEKVTEQFLLGTDEQRHAIICAESLTEKSKIGLKIARIKEAWTALDDKLNEERLQEWKAQGGKGEQPKRVKLAPTLDLIIDEAPIVINRILDGATVRNPGLTIDVFTELVQFAVSTGGRISIMSADLSVKEHELFSKLLGLTDYDWLNENTVSCINAGIRTALPNKRRIFLSNHLQATKKRIYSAVNQAVDEGQVVFIASNKVKPSSTATSTIAEQIKVNCGEHIRVLELNAKTVVNKKHPAHAFMNANEHQQMLLLQEIDVVVATSVVEAGVSWDARLFDDVPDNLIRNIFCIDADGRWSSSGILQAINRWRNPDVPAEICTTDRRMCRTDLKFDADFQPDKIKNQMVQDRDAFAMMLMGIFSQRRLEKDAWLKALAQKESQEQIQLRNPLAAVSAVAKAMGHIVTMIDDSNFNQAEKIDAQIQAKLITRRHRHIRNAIAARAISLEGAQRIQDCVTTMVYERVRTSIAVASAGADVNALLQVGVAELEERNQQLSLKGKQPTRAQAVAEQQRKLDAFEFLEPGHRLTLKAFKLLQQTGLHTAAIADTSVDGADAAMVKQMAEMFVADVSAGPETLLPVLGRKALKELSRQQTKTDEVQLLLERLAVMEEFELDEELTAPAVEMPAYAWMDLTNTQLPDVLRKRLVIEADEQTRQNICNAAIADVPIDTSTGRIIELSRMVKAAHYGSNTRAFELLTGFERTFGTEVIASDYLGFVRSALVDSSWLTETDIAAIGDRAGSCTRWITANIDRIDKYSNGHCFLFSDSPELVELAELIHDFKQGLGGLMPSAHNSITKRGGGSNHLRFIRGVLSETSLFELITIGSVNVGRTSKTLLVLKRKSNVPSEDECQRLYQRWLTAIQPRLKELNALQTFEEGELAIQTKQSANDKNSIAAPKPMKQQIKQLSYGKRKEYADLSEDELHNALIEEPEYKGNSHWVKRKVRSQNISRHRRLHRRIL